MIRLDPDTAQRRAADRGASVWVAASAGTGKTKVLTDRVLALMLGGSDPTRILCITFTKAAAAEMANRIHERLLQWSIAADGSLVQDIQRVTGTLPDRETLSHARRLFARVLDAPGGLRIATIHAFCQSLLRRFPLEARIAPHFEVMDERSAEEALATARDAMLATARDGADAKLTKALAHVTERVAEDKFDVLLGTLVLERARLGQALAEGEEGFRRRLYRLLDVAPGSTAMSVMSAACAPGAANEATLAAAVAIMADGSSTDGRRAHDLAAWLDNPASRMSGFDRYVDVFFTKKGEPRQRLITQKLAAAHPEAAEALAAEGERLGEVLRRRSAAALCEASLALSTLAAALLRLYQQHKSARALLDYDDLILKTRDLLRRPGVAPWVLFKLDGGLDHILIDEAQDTNPEQWEIVAALAEEFFSGGGARDICRTVFAVGDGKQSIYSFQRADPSAFLRMRDHFAQRVRDAAGRWEVIDLDASFRSTAPVLAAVDAVFAQPRAREGVALDGLPVQHRATRAGQAGLVELWPPVDPVDAPEAAPWEPPVAQQRAIEPTARLARVIARQIADWIEDGEYLPSRDRRLKAGDVMVLVCRRGPFVVELVRALKQANVPVAGADRLRLADQLAIEDMLALGRFLLLPDDDLTLATVLKGPLFGIDEELLFRLAYPRTGTLWSELQRRAAEHPALDRATAELGALLARADFVPPFEFFAELLGARGGRQAMLARLGDEAGDPLDELLAAALAYERREGPSLQGFLHWLVAGDVEVKRDFDQRGRDEVRIMTVHGAKGLQAPVVFLPDTLQMPPNDERIFWSEDGLPLWKAHGGCDAPALAAAQAAAKTRREEEYRRLLYVAMTRAEDRLYLCGWRTKRDPSDGCWYALLQEGLAAAETVERFDFDTTRRIGAEGWTGQGLRLTASQIAKPAADAEPQAIHARATALPAWATSPPPPEPTPPRPLAPSRPQEEPAVRSPLVGEGRVFERGRIIHRLLQALPDVAAGSRTAAAQRYLARPVHGLDAKAQAEICREVITVLEHPDFAPFFVAGSAAEVPVVGLLGDRALSGQIDRLVVTPEAVLIVDYKSLRPPPLNEEDVAPVYLGQLAAYRAAIAAIYPDRPVRCALLWTDGPRLMPISPAVLDRIAAAAAAPRRLDAS